MAINAKKNIVLSFIEVYRAHPELWDTASPHYSNRSKKAAAYELLVEQLKPIEPDATRETVVKKINSLRSCFRKELKKVEDSKKLNGSSDNLYVPSLWYFYELMFLVDHETVETNASPGTSQDDPYEEPSVTQSTTQSPLSTICTSPPLPPSKPNDDSLPSSSRKRKQNSSTTVQDLLEKAVRYLERDDDDFCSTLAKTYACKMRELTSRQRLFADRLINAVLYDAQMNVLTEDSYIAHTQHSNRDIVQSWLHSQPMSSSNSVKSLIESLN